MSGQRSLVVRMAAFSVDILSFGRPWLCQAATVASSVSMRTGSRPSVRGTQTWNGNKRSDVTLARSAQQWSGEVELYLLRPEERDPGIVEELGTILPVKVAHVGDERRRDEDVATQGLLLLFILNDCLGPALLL